MCRHHHRYWGTKQTRPVAVLTKKTMNKQRIMQSGEKSQEPRPDSESSEAISERAIRASLPETTSEFVQGPE
jgi:hypothetical protein